MSYHEVEQNAAGEIVVREVPIEWAEMPSEGSDPSHGAATAPCPVSESSQASLMLTRIEPRGHILEHAGPVDGVVFIMSGSGDLGLPGREALPFRAGDIILLKAGTPHSWDGRGDETVLMGIAVLG